MEDAVEFLGPGDVITSDSKWFMPHATYTVEEFVHEMYGRTKVYDQWLDETGEIQQTGCQVLRVGNVQGWRRGHIKVRIKIMLEFEPETDDLSQSVEIGNDENLSPLDVLRE